MEIRAAAPDAAYVNTGIPKVAETPLEGSDDSAPMTFGPFPTEPATITKSPNSKGYSVRFEQDQERVDPIEKAIDSIFLFIDDVREASSTVRGDGESGCMSVVKENMDVTKTLERVTDGLCRNPCADPCAESCGQMQPPVDLMLDVQTSFGGKEEEKREEPEAEPRSQDAASTRARKMELEAMSKQNSVKDMSAFVAPEARVPAQASGSGTTMPVYSPVETIADKMRTMVPEDTLQVIMDAFTVKATEVRPDAAELAIKNGVDSDPIIEAIDRLILFFDDIQEALMNQKMDHLVKKMTEDLQAAFMEKRNSMTKLPEANAEPEYDRSDNTTVSQDTMKTANTVMIKPGSMQMAPEEYAEAVTTAAQMMSESAPEEDLSNFSKEDLHKKALERIMSEHPELEEGSSDYKTEAMILEELMKDAEQSIMNSRSQEQNPAEQLVVLGHSGTLTPIPEADEASAGTPASDMIEHGVMRGTIPEVPLMPVIPSEQEEPKEPEEPKETMETKKEPQKVAKQEQEPPKQAMDKAETDPLVNAIDNLILLYDDIVEEQQMKLNCEGCLGAPVPSDIADAQDEILEAVVEEKAIDEPRILKEFKKPIDSRGQAMLEEALRLVQEVRNTDGTSEALQTIRSLDENDPAAIPSAASDLMAKLGATFNDLKEPTNPQADKKFVVRGIEMSDSEKNRAIAQLVEAAFEESDKLRRALNSAVDHPALKGKEPTVVTPQMSSEMESDKQQAKVEFEIPEMMKYGQDPYIAWGGDDSELMASINADRKLSEMEHENIFRDVSKSLQESSGGIITRADNPEIFSIYKAPAFTEGNSGSAELTEDRFEDPAQAALKVLCAVDALGDCEGSADLKGQPDIVKSYSSDALRARDMGRKFPGWSLSKKREEQLRTKANTPTTP